MTPTPLVSVVVPNYNGETLLPACLEALAGQAGPAYEVLVVDDGSTDGSVDLVRRRFPNMRLLPLAANQGFAAACNAGVAAGRGSLIALVNTDVVVPRDFLLRLAETMEKEPGCWIVAPKILNRGQDPGAFPRNGTLNLTGRIIQNVFSEPDRIFGASGAALLFRREPLGAPFDPDYRFFYEDVQLSWRTWLQGGKVCMRPDLRVEHLGSATLGRSTRWQWLVERNRWLLALSCWQKGTWLRLAPLWLAALVLENLQALGSWTDLSSRCQAYAWLVCHLPAIARKRRELQSLRKVPDSALFGHFSYKLTNATHWAGRLLNFKARCWCRLAGLKTYELLDKSA